MTSLSNLLPVGLTTVDRAGALPTDVQAGGAGAEKVATDFESLLISLLLKEMRQTTEGEGLFGGEASDTYGSLFDLYFSQHLANGGGLGLGEMIKASLETGES